MSKPINIFILGMIPTVWKSYWKILGNFRRDVSIYFLANDVGIYFYADHVQCNFK